MGGLKKDDFYFSVFSVEMVTTHFFNGFNSKQLSLNFILEIFQNIFFIKFFVSSKAEAVVQLADWSLPTPEISGSNPNITNLSEVLICLSIVYC